jgi:hypothetical protein
MGPVDTAKTNNSTSSTWYVIQTMLQNQNYFLTGPSTAIKKTMRTVE